MTNVVDCAFPIVGGETIPIDHGYAVYSAICRQIPEFHDRVPIGVHPIRGKQTEDRRLAVTRNSCLVVRTPSDLVWRVLALAGQPLGLANTRLKLGVPRVYPLVPRSILRSRLVTIKLSAGLTEDLFLATAWRQLIELGVNDRVAMTVPRRDGRPKRRTLRIKDKEVVGYELIIQGLTADESIVVQERGLGGRRKMGCGVFTTELWHSSRTTE